ncbi:MAG TPA: XrtB/PEP-CTERM-associated transcriptional regulator EpsA [Gallionella sp.]|nr:XrtB/PEP-CTERM-associated transcriptional regulator EpsA [Gallionella sp.]
MIFLNDEFTLAGEDPERFVCVVNSSLRVTSEPQFYAWVQGDVQYLLPHEILVCAIVTGGDAKMRYYRFSSTLQFREQHFRSVCDPVDGLLTQMMERTLASGAACALDDVVSFGDCDQAWLPLLQNYELRNVAGYGLRGSDGSLRSYFCFARLSDALDQRTLYLLEILIPLLDAALSRVVANESVRDKSNYQEALPLSRREIEVLQQVMKGKTNQMIAGDMNLSPLTIKNHIQNIMRKLKVKTRGHAVANGIKLGLLKSNRNISDRDWKK